MDFSSLPLPEKLKVLQVLFLFLSLSVSVLLAVYGFRVHRSTEKKKATISATERILDSRDIREGRKVLYHIHFDDDVDIRKYAKGHLPPDKEKERDSILLLINHYEQLGVGVKKGIYDVEIIDEFVGTSIITAWQYVQTFVAELRTRDHQPSSYKNFEILQDDLRTRRKQRQ